MTHIAAGGAATHTKGAGVVDGRPLRVDAVGLAKRFRREGGAVVDALADVSVGVRPGEIMVLLGPSGCGKSTLLRCIAGLETPDAGRITIDSAVVYDGASGRMVPPHERDVNMMFQSYALWPHMTLSDNVAFPLRVAGRSKVAARREAEEYLTLVGLPGLGGQYPGAISGGQQQRVALARTLVSKPSVVLFDEPLSNVDAKVRTQLRRELLRLHRELGFAAVYVTHDQTEAMAIGNQIVVMRDGAVEQVGDPISIYEYPVSRYAAEFVGEANIFDAVVAESRGRDLVLRCPIGMVEVPRANVPESLPPLQVGDECTFMVRPEYCVITSADAGGETPVPGPANEWWAEIDTAMYVGARAEYVCRLGGEQVIVWSVGSSRLIPPETKVMVRAHADGVRLLARR